MLPFIQLGPVAIPVPAMVILIGIWVGVSLSEKMAGYYRVKPNQLSNLILLSLITGVLAARITYIIQYSDAFIINPLDVFSRNPGLLNPIGGVTAGIIAGFMYGQRNGMPFWNTLDALTPGLAAMTIAFGISHLASGSAFGSPSDLPWSIELWGLPRHPTQIYEIIASSLILWFVLPQRKIWINKPPGVVFLTCVGLISTSRIAIETFRGDSPISIYGLRTPQLLAWLVLLISLISIGLRMRTNEDLKPTRRKINSDSAT